jgi:hypothetical protein
MNNGYPARKSAEKIQVSLKFVKNNGHPARKPVEKIQVSWKFVKNNGYPARKSVEKIQVSLKFVKNNGYPARKSVEKIQVSLKFVKNNGYLALKYVEKIQVSLKFVKNNITLHEDQYMFMIMSRSAIRRMRCVSDESCTYNQNTHCIFNDFISENPTVEDIMWQNDWRTRQTTDCSTIWRVLDN